MPFARTHAIVLLLVVIVAGAGQSAVSAAEATEAHVVSIDAAELFLAPYVWKRSGEGANSRAEAVMPGAYLKGAFQGSTTVELVVDGTGNAGCPPSSMPVIEYSIDGGEFHIVPLTRTNEVYRLHLAESLPANVPHTFEVVFRAADLTLQRWTSPQTHLCIAGLVIAPGGQLLPPTVRPRRAIAFGDSITEGVGADGLFKSWQSLEVNSARAAWFPIACAALDCEYGQLGSGGQGMTREIHLPPLTKTWDRHDANTSRLTAGRLLPEPDYIFCEMGTNDYEKVITEDYTAWLSAMRQACPHARFFCIIPPLGLHQDEIRAAVAARAAAGDRRVTIIDTAGLRALYRVGQGATQAAYDGVHPSQWGHALLGALVAAEVQKALADEPPKDRPSTVR